MWARTRWEIYSPDGKRLLATGETLEIAFANLEHWKGMQWRYRKALRLE